LLRLTRTRAERVLEDIALAEKNGRAAIDYFRRADVGHDGYPVGDCQACQGFDLGRAFDVDEKPDSASSITSATSRRPGRTRRPS
jgi:hypothetical protein